MLQSGTRAVIDLVDGVPHQRVLDALRDLERNQPVLKGVAQRIKRMARRRAQPRRSKPFIDGSRQIVRAFPVAREAVRELPHDLQRPADERHVALAMGGLELAGIRPDLDVGDIGVEDDARRDEASHLARPHTGRRDHDHDGARLGVERSQLYARKDAEPDELRIVGDPGIVLLACDAHALEGQREFQPPRCVDGLHHRGDVAEVLVGGALIVAVVAHAVEPPGSEVERVVAVDVGDDLVADEVDEVADRFQARVAPLADLVLALADQTVACELLIGCKQLRERELGFLDASENGGYERRALGGAALLQQFYAG